MKNRAFLFYLIVAVVSLVAGLSAQASTIYNYRGKTFEVHWSYITNSGGSYDGSYYTSLNAKVILDDTQDWSQFTGTVDGLNFTAILSFAGQMGQRSSFSTDASSNRVHWFINLQDGIITNWLLTYYYESEFPNYSLAYIYIADQLYHGDRYNTGYKNNTSLDVSNVLNNGDYFIIAGAANLSPGTWSLPNQDLPIPEPCTIFLLGSGLAGLVVTSFKKLTGR